MDDSDVEYHNNISKIDERYIAIVCYILFVRSDSLRPINNLSVI